MTRKELEQQVQAMMDGTLDQVGFDSLQAELRANAESRAFYRQSMEIEILLAEAMQQQNPQIPRFGILENLLRGQLRRNLRKALFAAAAVLVAMATVMVFVRLHQSGLPTLTCAVVPGTQWRVNGEARNSQSDEEKVAEGSTVSVLSGTVVLRLKSGAAMILRGPVTASFPALTNPVLQHGWLWIDSGNASEAFKVTTPELHVRNVGTRFGVRVRDNGATEIHLVDGQLGINSAHLEQERVDMKPTGEGVLFQASGERAMMPLEQDPFPGLPELLTARPSYPTIVLSQGPAGYWRLDDQTGFDLANEISKGSRGNRDSETMLGMAGVGDGDAFMGFEQANTSAYLTGKFPKSLLSNLDMPGGVSREEGAVTFWIRKLPERERNEILWLVGENPAKNAIYLPYPITSIMHTRLSASGRVEFFIKNRGFDVLLSSNFSVVDGKWHHIAASWEASAAELYVDGKRVGRADDFGSLQQGFVRGSYIRFGKPCKDIENMYNPFTGWVDEIALWNRPLTAAEVQRQFEAAQGLLKTTGTGQPGGGK